MFDKLFDIHERGMMLTTAKIKAIKTPGWYAVDTTLYLRVAPGGSKQFVQRLVVRGKRIDMGLGGWPLTSLDEARERAFRSRKIARDGGNPVAERKERASIPTFAKAVQEVVALHQSTWKNPKQKKREWETSFALHVLPVLGDMLVSDIEASHVLRVLEPLWSTKNETGQKVKRRISAVLDWCVTSGLRLDNPVSSVTVVLPKVKRQGNYKAIPHEQVAGAIQKIHGGTAHLSTRSCFEFVVLTATRSQEGRGAQWAEVDLAKKIWTVPGSRTKTGRDFRVPLSHRAVEILEDQKARTGDSPLVFPSPSGKVMSDATMSKMVRVAGIAGVPHGFRASFRSWCADMNINREIAESCLAHVVQGTEGRYQRSDLFRQRAIVMQKWSDYLNRATAKQSKVVHLR